MDNIGFGSSMPQGGSTAVAPWNFTILTGLVFSGVFIIYLGLSLGYQTFLEKSISDTEAKMNTLNTGSIDAKSRDQFIGFYSRSVNLQRLLNNHVTIGLFLDLLESKTLGEVYYSDAKLDISSKTASLTGLAKDFKTLASQATVYQKTPNILGVSIIDSKSSEKGVSFEPKLTIDPSIFSYKNLKTITPSTPQ